MPTYVIGISALYHDSAIALLRDGEVVFAAQEERYSRIKNHSGFPAKALGQALAHEGIHISEVAYAAYYENPWTKLSRIVESQLTSAPNHYAEFRSTMERWTRRNVSLDEEMPRWLGEGWRGELCFVEHHGSHAAAAFYPSPFHEASVITLDAVGEWTTSSLGVGRGNRVRITHERSFPHSIGMLYSAFTSYLGFEVNEGEYKVMGLAPYGKPRYLDEVALVAETDETGGVSLDMSYFDFLRGGRMTSAKLHTLFGRPPRAAEARLTEFDMDVAASIQRFCEEAVLKTARYAHELDGLPNLVMAGGVALNCVANGRLARESPFEKIWVQPAAGDAGAALGAALLVWHQHLGEGRTVRPNDSQAGSLLGTSSELAEIETYLLAMGARFERIDDEARLLSTVAQQLAEEKITGWFAGRMEYGPRSLGCRSIIGDPRPPSMQSRMNLSIKFRESFRPFAPCVLAEHAHECFEVPAGEDSPYMLFVSHVQDAWRIPLSPEDQARSEDPDLMVRLGVQRSRIPAVTHVDYSARIQTIDEARHGRFYRLLRRFHALTGCPVLVNTSFNVRGEPIVCSPEDAFHCFLKTDMDCLVLENFVLRKADQPEELIAHVKDAY